LHAISDTIIHIIISSGYFGVFFWMAVGSACVPVPSEVIMPFAGAMMITKGIFNFHLLALTGALGNLAGSIVAYFAGAWGGRPFLQKYGKYVLIRQRDIDKADRAFARYGEAIVFFGRMIPLIRAFVSLPAGIAKMPFGRFCVYTFFGGLAWSYLLTWLGLNLGEKWDLLHRYFQKADLAIGIAVVILFVFWLWHHLRPDDSPHDQPALKEAVAADQPAAEG